MGSGSSKGSRILVKPCDPNTNTHPTNTLPNTERHTSRDYPVSSSSEHSRDFTTGTQLNATQLGRGSDSTSDALARDLARLNHNSTESMAHIQTREHLSDAPAAAVPAAASADDDDDDGVLVRQRSSEMAHSARSGASGDSGIFELSEDNSRIITEFSPPHLVKSVENDFVTPENKLELMISGKAIDRLQSGSQKNRLEEQNILKMLRVEGLMATAKVTNGKSTSFAIVDADCGAAASMAVRHKLPPLHRQRLEQSRQSHTRAVDTQVDLHEKELRRKAAEEQKVRRISYRQQNLEAAVQKRVDTQEQQLRIRIGSALEKRQLHLNRLRDRLREKHNRAEIIRLSRPASGPDNGHGSPTGSPDNCAASRHQLMPGASNAGSDDSCADGRKKVGEEDDDEAFFD